MAIRQPIRPKSPGIIIRIGQGVKQRVWRLRHSTGHSKAEGKKYKQRLKEAREDLEKAKKAA